MTDVVPQMTTEDVELAIEQLLFDRSLRNRIVGYTVETAHEIMAIILPCPLNDDPFALEKVLRFHAHETRVFDTANDTVLVNRTLLNKAADMIARLLHAAESETAI